MTDANKVIGFLNCRLLGSEPCICDGWCHWRHLGLYRLILKRESPLFETEFSIPTARQIDARLVFGAGIFGIGWGLVDLPRTRYCFVCRYWTGGDGICWDNVARHDWA